MVCREVIRAAKHVLDKDEDADEETAGELERGEAGSTWAADAPVILPLPPLLQVKDRHSNCVEKVRVGKAANFCSDTCCVSRYAL